MKLTKNAVIIARLNVGNLDSDPALSQGEVACNLWLIYYIDIITISKPCGKTKQDERHTGVKEEVLGKISVA